MCLSHGAGQPSPGCTDDNFLIFLYNNQLDFVFMETKKNIAARLKLGPFVFLEAINCRIAQQ